MTTLPDSYISGFLSERLRKLAKHIGQLESELNELRERDALASPLDVAAWCDHMLRMNSLVPEVAAARAMLTDAVQALIDFELNTTPTQRTH